MAQTFESLITSAELIVSRAEAARHDVLASPDPVAAIRTGPQGAALIFLGEECLQAMQALHLAASVLIGRFYALQQRAQAAAQWPAELLGVQREGFSGG